MVGMGRYSGVFGGNRGRATLKAIVRFCLRCRMAVWRKRHAAFIRRTRGMVPRVRAVCLALGTGVSVWFVHDAIFNESNAGIEWPMKPQEGG